jgi:hypothetical protein
MLLAALFALAISLQLPAAHAADGSVANATFTSGVTDGAPIDYRQEFFNNTPVVYYYSELLDLGGQTIHYRWTLEGKLMHEVPMHVTHARQAAWSWVEMQPDWTGNWTVEVVDARGDVLDRSNFAYNPN